MENFIISVLENVRLLNDFDHVSGKWEYRGDLSALMLGHSALSAKRKHNIDNLTLLTIFVKNISPCDVWWCGECCKSVPLPWEETSCGQTWHRDSVSRLWPACTLCCGTEELKVKFKTHSVWHSDMLGYLYIMCWGLRAAPVPDKCFYFRVNYFFIPNTCSE